MIQFLFPSHQGLDTRLQAHPAWSTKFLENRRRLRVVYLAQVFAALEVGHDGARRVKLAELIEHVVPVVRARDCPEARAGDGGKGEGAKVDEGDVLDGDVVL